MRKIYSILLVFGLGFFSAPLQSNDDSLQFYPRPISEITSSFSFHEQYVLLNFLYVAYKASLLEQYARLYTILALDKAWDTYAKVHAYQTDADLAATSLLSISKNLNIILPEHIDMQVTLHEAELYLESMAWENDIWAALDCIQDQGRHLLIKVMDNNQEIYTSTIEACVDNYGKMQTWLQSVAGAFQNVLDGTGLPFIDYGALDPHIYDLVNYDAIRQICNHTVNMCETTVGVTLSCEHKLLMKLNYAASLLYAYYYNELYTQISTMTDDPFFVIFSSEGIIPQEYRTQELPAPDITVTIEL